MQEVSDEWYESCELESGNAVESIPLDGSWNSLGDDQKEDLKKVWDEAMEKWFTDNAEAPPEEENK